MGGYPALGRLCLAAARRPAPPSGRSGLLGLGLGLGLGRRALARAEGEGEGAPPFAEGAGHYERFRLEPRFAVDLAELEARMKGLQKALHPDKAAALGPAAQERAALYSSLTNESYAVLRDPVTRALHLLETHGVDVERGLEQTIEDPALLMEVMELREEVEEAGAGEGGGAGAAAALEALRARSDARVAASERAVAAAFDAGDIAAAKDATIRLIYMRKVGDEILERL